MRLAHQRVRVGQQRADLETKQRVVIHARLVTIHLRHDGHIGPALVQQAYRVGVKAAHDVQLHLRPAGAKRVHGGHQPVKAGVAFHRNAHLPALPQHQAGNVALGPFHLRQHGVGQRQQAFAHGGELGRNRFALKQRLAVAVFQQLDLVRQRRLREVEQLRGPHQAAAVAQGDQRAQVAHFQDRPVHY